ncbi:cytochrome b [Aquabacter sp. CN5-332]|uniref:cytochrome b n=1 Tax=Aquabacter sp. CN5-332 TaxID=3156608 RepID=UPI0032B5E8FD
MSAATSVVARYPSALRLIHWTTVLGILIAYGLTYAEALFARGSAGRAWIWWTHISVGLLILALVCARVMVRGTTPMPPPSAALTPLMHFASRAAHLALYALLFAVPLIGIWLAFLRGNEVSFFGLFTIPAPIPVDRPFGRQVQEVHEWLANALIAVAAIHGAAALWHHFVRRDDVLARMLPGRR